MLHSYWDLGLSLFNMEHRCGTRYQVDLLVHVRSHGGSVSSVGRLRDISMTGGFILTTLPAHSLSRVLVRVSDAEGRSRLTLEGHIIRKDANGLGVEWSEQTLDLAQRLIRSIAVEAITTYPAKPQADAL